MAHTFDTIVVGIGGMGAATLYHPAKRGQRVLGLERFQLGHTRGSSHGETRAIRKSYFEGAHYVPLVLRAYDLWDALSIEAGQHLIHRTGTLEMSEPGIDYFERSQACCLEHGLEHQIFDAPETMRRFPAFRLQSETRALYQPDGGYVMCDAALQAHVALALHHGAGLHTGETVHDIRATSDGGVELRTSERTYFAGHVVLTAGPWMRQLVPALADILVTTKQALAWFSPPIPNSFQRGVFPVFIHFSAAGEFYGFPLHGDQPTQGVKIGGPHFARVPLDPDADDRSPEPHQIQALQGFSDRYLPGIAGPPVAAIGCIYTSTPNDNFIIDWVPDSPQVLFVSACSGHGYKFAPAIGEVAADLVTQHSSRTDIKPFSLARFRSA